MTFAEGVFRIVRIGARNDEGAGAGPSAASATRAAARMTEAAAVFSPAAAPSLAEPAETLEALALEEAQEQFRPGLTDLEASVALVVSGVATRIDLTGFPSWPGLLWRAYQMADNADVMIIPTVVRPGGKVDIVIARSDRALV